MSSSSNISLLGDKLKRYYSSKIYLHQYKYPKTSFDEIEISRHVVYRTPLRVLIENIFAEDLLNKEKMSQGKSRWYLDNLYLFQDILTFYIYKNKGVLFSFIETLFDFTKDGETINKLEGKDLVDEYDGFKKDDQVSYKDPIRGSYKRAKIYAVYKDGTIDIDVYGGVSLEEPTGHYLTNTDKLSKQAENDDFSIGEKVVYLSGKYYIANILGFYEDNFFEIVYDEGFRKKIEKDPKLFKEKVYEGFKVGDEVVYVNDSNHQSKASILGTYEEDVFEIRNYSRKEIFKKPKLLRSIVPAGGSRVVVGDKAIYEDPQIGSSHYRFKKVDILSAYEEDVFEIDYGGRQSIVKGSMIFAKSVDSDFKNGDEVTYAYVHYYGSGYSQNKEHKAKIIESYENDLFEIEIDTSSYDKAIIIVKKDKLRK